jgi:general secretion pathway protein K
MEGNEHDRGLALVSVLWGISILSLIAAAVMSSTVLSRHMERNAWERTRAEVLTQAAVNRAVLGIGDARADARWRIDGTPQALALDGAQISVRVEDELGKIDLNAAAGDTFQRLFRAAGLEPVQADALANRVVEWRSDGESHAVSSDGDAGYRTAGLSYLPRHGAFQSVDEIKLVLGMTQQIFARVQPALTVYSQRPYFDSNVAPKEALLTLPNMEESTVDAMLEERRNGQGVRASIAGGLADPAASLTGRAFTVLVTVTTGKAKTTTRVAIRLTGDPTRPYLIMDWS